MFGTAEAMRGSGNSEEDAKRFYKPAFTRSSKKERNKNLGPSLTSEDFLSTAIVERDSSTSQEKEGMGLMCVCLCPLCYYTECGLVSARKALA